MNRLPPRRRLAGLLGAALVVCVSAAACAWTGGGPGDGGPADGDPAAGGAPVAVTLAFAGDVHFAGTSQAAITEGLGSGAAPLRSADLAVLNLETAITEAGEAAPGKQFVFRAPPQALDAVRAAGVDAVSLANNHGMDYGVSGLEDTLAAAVARELPVLGAGRDAEAAWAPLRRTIRGVRVSVLAATDVLDDELRELWTAGPGKPGMASAKDGTAFADAVAAERGSADVLVAFVHWGAEKQVCPTPRQRELAQQLVDAGADLVVGSHAHVLQPMTSVPTAAGRSVVAYGLGNFVFYGRTDQATRSGVLTVTATARPGGGPQGERSVQPRWTGARIVSGRPQRLSRAEAAAIPLPAANACR